METLKKILVPFLSLVPTVLVIGWNIYSKDTRALKLVETDRQSLIKTDSVKAIGKGLSISYYGYPIENITKYDFRLQNLGSLSIDETDVKAPIGVQFKGNCIVLISSIKFSVPSDLQANTSVTQDTAYLDFVLLNVSDEIAFSVLVSGDVEDIKPIGRIVDVSEISYESYETEVPKPALNQGFRWYDYGMAALGLFFLFIAVFYALQKRKQILLKEKYADSSALISDFGTVQKLKEFYQRELRFFSLNNPRALRRILEESDGNKLVKEVLQEIQNPAMLNYSLIGMPFVLIPFLLYFYFRFFS